MRKRSCARLRRDKRFFHWRPREKQCSRQFAACVSGCGVFPCGRRNSGRLPGAARSNVQAIRIQERRRVSVRVQHDAPGYRGAGHFISLQRDVAGRPRANGRQPSGASQNALDGIDVQQFAVAHGRHRRATAGFHLPEQVTRRRVVRCRILFPLRGDELGS